MIGTVAKCITPCQFGFQSNSSTLQQLLLCHHQLITSKDEVDVVHIDFRKTFDSVPHNQLLVKLWNTGITGTLWKWFKSYSYNRVQCISINNCLSNCLPVRVLSGVPQDSILGPLLNDLPSDIHSSNMFVFADDTKCFLRIKSELDIQRFQEDLYQFLIGVVTITLPSVFQNLFFYVITTNLIHCILSTVMPFLAPIVVKILVSFSLIVYDGDYTIKTLLLKLINLLDYFVVYLKTVTVWRLGRICMF